MLALLAQAMNEMDLPQYEKLLADSFVFHFWPLDVSNGNVDVPSWRKLEETEAVSNMFDPNFPDRMGTPADTGTEDVTWGMIKALYSDHSGWVWRQPVSNINLTLTYPTGDSTWSEVPEELRPPNIEGALYEKTFSYLLSVVAGTTTFVSGQPMPASVIIRLADDIDMWQIVTWRDIAN